MAQAAACASGAGAAGERRLVTGVCELGKACEVHTLLVACDCITCTFSSIICTSPHTFAIGWCQHVRHCRARKGTCRAAASHQQCRHHSANASTRSMFCGDEVRLRFLNLQQFKWCITADGRHTAPATPIDMSAAQLALWQRPCALAQLASCSSSQTLAGRIVQR